jgi:hypothetical protein
MWKYGKKCDAASVRLSILDIEIYISFLNLIFYISTKFAKTKFSAIGSAHRFL